MPKRKANKRASNSAVVSPESISAIQNFLAKQIANAVKQIESYMGIQHYVNTGKVMPSFHGWPISPDLGEYLIRRLESQNYDLVIEFGSGASSWVIGQVRKNKKFKHVVFEHLSGYFEKTKDQLAKDGLLAEVELRMTPMQDWVSSEGVTYSYYDCHAALAEHAKQLNPTGCRVLVLIDGPPASTGRHARYPALAHVLAHFPTSDVDFLLDDFIRIDEQEILDLWRQELSAAKVQHTFQIIRMEKDAALLSVTQSIPIIEP
jgi:hypothetical protein